MPRASGVVPYRRPNAGDEGPLSGSSGSNAGLTTAPPPRSGQYRRRDSWGDRDEGLPPLGVRRPSWAGRSAASGAHVCGVFYVALRAHVLIRATAATLDIWR